MSLLPTSLEESGSGIETEEESAVVGLQDESDVFSVLAAEGAREVLVVLYEEPAAASGVARRVETSVQNAQYHLENLVDAGVVEGVGTRYSSRGREMTVYGPAENPLTVVLGDAECVDTCRAALTDTDAE